MAADERAKIIAMEKQMRAERLGLVPKTRRQPVGNNLVEHELQLLKRGQLERDPKDIDANRVDGLGAADAPMHYVCPRTMRPDLFGAFGRPMWYVTHALHCERICTIAFYLL